MPRNHAIVMLGPMRRTDQITPLVSAAAILVAIVTVTHGTEQSPQEIGQVRRANSDSGIRIDKETIPAPGVWGRLNPDKTNMFYRNVRVELRTTTYQVTPPRGFKIVGHLAKDGIPITAYGSIVTTTPPAVPKIAIDSPATSRSHRVELPPEISYQPPFVCPTDPWTICTRMMTREVFIETTGYSATSLLDSNAETGRILRGSDDGTPGSDEGAWEDAQDDETADAHAASLIGDVRRMTLKRGPWQPGDIIPLCSRDERSCEDYDFYVTPNTRPCRPCPACLRGLGHRPQKLPTNRN